MPTLGSIFGDEEKQKFVERQLTPGAVLHLQVVFPQTTKNKYLVLVGIEDPDCYTFIVNSETSRFIQKSPDLWVCQVDIDAVSHPFLRYDSKVACHEVLRLSKVDVVAELIADTGKIKGTISTEVRQEIVAATKYAKTLDRYTQQLIVDSLSE